MDLRALVYDFKRKLYLITCANIEDADFLETHRFIVFIRFGISTPKFPNVCMHNAYKNEKILNSL